MRTSLRQNWVSALKGLAILAVVIGHIATPLTKFVYAWHVPLFFFVSGFFLISKESWSLQRATIKDIQRLILPFIGFASIALCFELLKRSLLHGYTFATPTIRLRDEISGTFLWMDMEQMHHYGFVLWFLPALFWGKLIARLLIGTIQSTFLALVVVGALFTLGAFVKVNLPFGFDQGMIAALWVLCGYFLYPLLRNLSKIKASILALILLILAFLLPIPYLNVATKFFDNPLYNVVYSLVMIGFVSLAILSLSKILRLKGLEHWGNHTLTIFVLHPYTNNIAFLLAIKFLPRNQWVVAVVLSVALINLFLIIFHRLLDRPNSMP